MAAPIRAAILFSDLPVVDQLQWKKILLEGMVDAQNYYLSDNKKLDYAAEFLAAQDLLIKSDVTWGKLKAPIACVFPARVNFLKKLKLIPLEIGKNCKDYQDWKNGINANSISVVFSSAYVNNPASAFGHTFLRFNQANKKSDLLDYAAAYSANIYTDDLGPVYVFKGLTGGYTGGFSLEPYYMKVNSYNDFEGRDLLEYELNLNSEEVSRVVDVLWELYNTGEINYYFLTENCSSVLGALLEAGRASLDLKSAGWWYYLPAELMVKLHDEILKVSYRPSLKKKIEESLEQIDESKIKKYYQDLLPTDKLTAKELDALLQLAELRQIETKDKESLDEKKWHSDLLLNRSKKAATADEKPMQDISSLRPELAHKKRKIHVGVGSIFQFKFYNGQHDLLDHDRGSVPFSQFTLFSPSISYFIKEKEWSAKDTDFINISALPLYRFYDKKISWRVQTGIKQESIKRAGHDIVQAAGSLGLTWGQDRWHFSQLFGAHATYSSSFNHNLELGPLSETLLVYDITPSSDMTYKGMLLTTIRKNFLGWNENAKTRVSLGHGMMGNKGQIILEHAYEATGDFSHQIKVGFYF